MGLSPLGWAAVLALALGAGAYLLYRRSKSQAATSTAATTTDTGTGTDVSGQLATLQDEIMNLQASEAGDASTGGTGGGGTGGGPPPPAGNGTPPPTPTGTPPPAGTGGKQAPPPAVTGLHPTTVTPTSIGLAWNKSNGATSYQIRITYQSKVAKPPQTASGTSGTVSGLTPDHTYGVHVVAIGPGGWAPESSTVVHTPKTASSAANATAANVKKAG
jgi:hypothetical protein